MAPGCLLVVAIASLSVATSEAAATTLEVGGPSLNFTLEDSRTNFVFNFNRTAAGQVCGMQLASYC